MNEQLQGKLVEILSGIQTATKAAGDFAMEQLPDIAQSYVLYGRVVSAVLLLLAIAVTAGCVYVGLFKGALDKEAVKKCRYGSEETEWKDSRIFLTIFGGIFGLVSLIPLCFAITSAALVWFAPKIWLLKELAWLIK